MLMILRQADVEIISKDKEVDMKQLYELQRMDLTDLLLYAQKAGIHLFSAEREDIIKTIHDTECCRQSKSMKPDIEFFERHF